MAALSATFGGKFIHYGSYKGLQGISQLAELTNLTHSLKSFSLQVCCFIIIVLWTVDEMQTL